MNTNKVKKYNRHQAEIEIAKLKKYIPLVVEYKYLLKDLEAQSFSDFEKQLNEKTGFVKASLSAEALGFENEYKRLTEIEKSINGVLHLEDVVEDKIKEDVLFKIKEKYTTYFTKEELESRKVFDKIIKLYNELPQNVRTRNHIGFNRNHELTYNPFIR